MGIPRKVSEEEVKAAAQGKSEEVMAAKRPVDLTEHEVKAASQGKSKEVLASKIEKGQKKDK
jgi:hypothetical protein